MAFKTLNSLRIGACRRSQASFSRSRIHSDFTAGQRQSWNGNEDARWGLARRWLIERIKAEIGGLFGGAAIDSSFGASAVPLPPPSYLAIAKIRPHAGGRRVVVFARKLA